MLDQLMQAGSDWLRWKGPLFAEKKFWETRKKDPACIMYPWKSFLEAKLLDNIHLKKLILRAVLVHMESNCEIENYYTFCEMKDYKPLLPFLKELGIQTLYIMNKENTGKVEEGIQIRYFIPYTLNEIKKISSDILVKKGKREEQNQ